jgi:hypothetical protein
VVTRVAPKLEPRSFGAIATLTGVVLIAPVRDAHAECRILDVSFATQPTNVLPDALPQVVAWLEDAAGNFVDTVYITHATGTFGIGNRPGRFDFNSGYRWPYGRRITTFPVWAHRHGLSWPELVFHGPTPSNPPPIDDRLSHDMDVSSKDFYFCRPLEADAMTCPSERVLTDKGKFGPGQSLYPPRNDLAVLTEDSADVEMFATLNPFDAVSQPTPAFGLDAAVSYTVSPDVPAGDYMLFVEVSKELDMNASYNPTIYPPPSVPFAAFGQPYRGQPSVVYRVPVQLVNDESVSTTTDYLGYGDPDGLDGTVRPPDSSISVEPGSGANRLALLSTDGATYRVRVASRREDDLIAPDAPREANVADVSASRATVELIAPGDDGAIGPVKGYEVRYRIGEPITEDNFGSSRIVVVDASIVGPGEVQALTIEGLLPETDYSIGIRAFDNCRNTSPLIAFDVTTPERKSGEVDACFIATAAYGSEMAADVGLLRDFRDALLRKTALGELAVEAYYTFGPPAAGVVGESDLLRATARRALAPLVTALRPRPDR